ncbi:dipeptide/oligopeptide/nickel ABC transporter permease/ATP-binding protein [Jatrophihabitans cynanchi]|uniref:Dipeptide/oligopeptide/nickel ABC transporter permease/ATP-binding protein n=1 Tax=Jatrophihabitans cynanchi TaxID=2944128 RepID=A0ABY7JT58_9ACTN|nr:dipeptide/oligopeptide/nickel ABC transporter permease/ATP-binding protein [Jatrophihabitans sp. SB3-54]WAX55751.1 dipeptide/oligopeptide/nickel ABC transporter permease/ATP-binding protein [Jatrophihabitans sp. SB3-54]
MPAPESRKRAVAARLFSVVRTPVGACAGALLLAVLLLAVLGPVLWSDRANAIDTDHILQGSSGAHWVGTDSLGRDIFYRVLVATRLSVGLALLATAIGVAIGLLLGAVPAVFGRRVGRLAAAVVNIAVAFPGLLLALFFAVVFGVGAKGAVLAIGVATAPGFARLVQTLVAGVAARDYVAAARIAGVGRVRLLARHILPNIAEPLVVNATMSAGGALLTFAGLSFLGLGVQAPQYDWGRLLGEGLNGIYVHPAAALAPGVAVVIAGLAFNLFGEAVARTIGLTVTGGGVVRRRVADDAPGDVADVEQLADAAVPAAGDQDADVLRVDGLRVQFPGADGPITPVRGVSFGIGRAEAVGVVGESGSGKSLTALAVAQLVDEPGRVIAQQLTFCGTDLLHGTARVHRQLLGTSFAMVFQDPMTSFNPTKRIGRQLAEVAEQHQGMSRSRAMERAVDRLRAVRVPAAERRARQYPHEFSGGMRQRAMIGMGVMGSPKLIVADEPTTALDVTVQQQVLRLLQAIRDADDVAILLISHDITVVGQMCDRVLVMYAGRIVEELPVAALRTDARHPYTRALLAAVPDMSTDRDAPLPVIPGRPVDPAHLPPGCPFAPRCERADARCRAADPELIELAGSGAGDVRRVACWHPYDGDADTDPSDDEPGQLGKRPRATVPAGDVHE